MEIVRPQTWAELQDALFDYPEGLTAPRRFRSPFAYRGMTRDHEKLTTSLMRLGGPFDELESSLLRNFRKYATGFENPGDNAWLWLAVAQHHGLPTRLLDWTYSPYVALHFATDSADTMDQDGVVWCIDFIRAKERLPRLLNEALENQGYAFTVDLLQGAVQDLDALNALGSSHGEPFVIFLEPPAWNERIVNQYSLFSLMSEPGLDLNDWLIRHPDLARKVVVPASLKRQARDHLDQANINERILFPGLDGLCRWLRRYYSPGQAL